MNRKTVIVEGPLAYRMSRIAAARAGQRGVQIATLPLLAARLAGGFTRPARISDLEPAIRTALEKGGFAEIECIRGLPGTARSIAQTLTKIWQADLCLAERAETSARLADLFEVERRVRRTLPDGVLTPRDLRDAAAKRIDQASAVLGSVELKRLGMVAPVWRPLIEAIASRVSVSWHQPAAVDVSWFPGQIVDDQQPEAAAPVMVSCANPRAEVVEALRWMRELISSHCATPEEIAICATNTADWDEHFLVLAADAGLPLHFSHGVPALASREGRPVLLLPTSFSTV